MIKEIRKRGVKSFMNGVRAISSKLLKNKLFFNIGIVLFENFASKGLNFVVILILARYLGPEEYGKYSFILVTISLLSAFSDMGMENTAIRFSSKYADLKNKIFGTYFVIKSCTLLVVFLGLLFFGNRIFSIMNKSEISKYLIFLMIGLVAESFLLINDTYLQALQKFSLRAMINISRNLLCLVLIGFLLFNHSLVLDRVFYTVFIPLGISLIFIFKYISFSRSLLKEPFEKEVLREILKYSLWMFLLAIANSILVRIDFFMVSILAKSKYDQIGIYNAAFQLATIALLLPYAINKVLLPTVSGMDSSELHIFIKKIFRPMAISSVAMVLLIPFSRPVVYLFLGAKYRASITILQILLVAFVVVYMTIPFDQAMYSMGKVKYIAIGCYMQILLTVVLSIFTIRQFGIVWAAINVVITRLLYGIYIASVYYRSVKRSNCIHKEVHYDI